MTGLAFSPDGQHLAIRCFDHTGVFPTAGGGPIHTVKSLGRHPCHVAFSPNWEAGGVAPRRTRFVLEVATGTRRELRGFASSLAFSPDGARLVYASGYALAERDTTTGQSLRSTTLPYPLARVAFAADGRLFAAGAGRVHVWDQVEAAPPVIRAPAFGVRSTANARRGKRAPTDAARFRASLAKLPWFSALGTPSRWDARCTRIASFAEWPGPEAAGANAYSAQCGAW